MRRRATRKQGGSGCGCGGMEILGFPKSGGFMSLFGGQEIAKSEPMMMKEQAPQEMTQRRMNAPQEMTQTTPQRRRSSSEEASSQEIIGNSAASGVSYAKQERPMKSQSSKSLNPLARELSQMKREIETLKSQVAGLQSSSGSPGLFGGARRKTHKKRKSLRRRKSRG